MKKNMSRGLTTIVVNMLLLVTFLPQSEAHEPPLEESAQDHSASSSVRLDDDDWPSIPVTRYTMLSRQGEVTWQMTGGVAAAFMPVVYSELLVGLTTDSYTLGRVALVSGVSALAGASAVYGFGRANSSNARLGGVALGALAGVGLNMLVFQGMTASDSSLQGLVYMSTTLVLPTVGAVVGYQLTSTWRSGESVHRQASMPLWYLMPTQKGVNAGVSLVF